MQTELLSCKVRRGLDNIRITRTQMMVKKTIEGNREQTTLCSANVRMIPMLHASAALGGASGHTISFVKT